MGDTQKSQTISTDNQGIAKQVALDNRSYSEGRANESSIVFEVESSLVRIAMLAKSETSPASQSEQEKIQPRILSRNH